MRECLRQPETSKSASILQHSAGYEIVQTPGDRDDSINDGFAIGPSVSRVDAVTGVKLAQAFESGVFVMKQLDEVERL